MQLQGRYYLLIHLNEAIRAQREEVYECGKLIFLYDFQTRYLAKKNVAVEW